MERVAVGPVALTAEAPGESVRNDRSCDCSPRLDYDDCRTIGISRRPRASGASDAAGLTFGTLAVDIDETVGPGEDPETYVRRLAREKSARAQAV